MNIEAWRLETFESTDWVCPGGIALLFPFLIIGLAGSNMDRRKQGAGCDMSVILRTWREGLQVAGWRLIISGRTV